MEPFNPRKKSQSEAEIQAQIVAGLKLRGWHVIVTHGNIFQAGLPDIIAFRRREGEEKGRTVFVEVKNPKGHRFTAAQKHQFPLIDAHGGEIYVLFSASPESLNKLDYPPNWYHVMYKQRGM